MKITAFLLFLCASTAMASPSLLTEFADIPGFGSVHYRPPVQDSSEPPIVLLHGIYGGVSHRTFKGILPGLDAAGKAVYIVDLPGVGQSNSPRRAYDIQDLDDFVEQFLQVVVRKPSVVVAESLLNLAALRVSSYRPDLIRRIVMLNPTGLNSLNEPPTETDQRRFERLYNDNEAGLQRYEVLLEDNSLRFFLQFGFFDDSLIDDDLLDDFRVAREFPSQRFITINFIGGQFWRSFEDATQGVFIPVLGLFGKEYEPFLDNPVSTAEDFRLVRPDFEYIEIENSGSSVQREKPEQVLEEILIFTEVN